MKNLLLVVGLALALVSGWLGSSLLRAKKEMQTEHAEKAHLQTTIQTLSAQLGAAASAKSNLEERLEREMASAADLKSQLAEAVAADTNAAAVEPIKPPAPFRVRTYLGRDLLGEAWLIPSKFEQDPKTGRLSYEPVLMLDEKYRKQFTVYQTNYVAEPVNTTVNYNYSPPETYYYPIYYPVTVGRRGHGRPDSNPPDNIPDRPQRPSFPSLPVRNVSGGGGSPWGSVWGGVRQQTKP